MGLNRAVVFVLDSCGCGGAPDASDFGDQGADTLGHTAEAVGGLSLPNLARLGLGNACVIKGVGPVDAPTGAFGMMCEQSSGKDTTSGHWEISGVVVNEPFKTYSDGYPQDLIDAFVQQTGRNVLGNVSASGTQIIEDLGQQHLDTGDWIVYTSVDSVFQIAAHEKKVPLEELYAACQIARKLCDPLNVGRVIARPFVGEPGAFERTYNRRDFGMLPPGPTMLDRLSAAKVPVVGVGKISDIFSGRGIDRSIHTEGNRDGVLKTVDCLNQLERGLVFINLIDFDTLYGHRRDPEGFAAALKEFDDLLPRIENALGDEDLLVITADHGNDPTYSGTDHTRERVPLVVARPSVTLGVNLGIRDSFADVAATVVDGFGLDGAAFGQSFWKQVQVRL